MNSLTKVLTGYTSRRMYSFHTPGHKGRPELLAPVNFPGFDLTELPGLDMLHNPRGVIAEAQKRAAAVYGAEETYFLVNGGTSGNQAMLLALTPFLAGKKIRIARNAHRSLYNALVLTGLVPEYIYPLIHPDFHLPLGLDTQLYLENLGDTGAFHLTCPTYYGTMADLERILAYREEKVPDLPVLVDQAHGAHYSGELFPPSAVKLGADLVVHSSHKTLAALTQTGMLHVRGKRIDRSLLRKSLEMLQTSSPSYLLLSSLDTAVSMVCRDDEIWLKLFEEVNLLRNKLSDRLRILSPNDAGSYGIHRIDWTKLLINLGNLELNGPEAVELLRSRFRIEPELWDEENILFVLGIGNKPEDIRHLSKALEKLTDNYSLDSTGRNINAKRKEDNRIIQQENMPLPPMRLTPREAWFRSKRTVKVKDSLGLICGETVSVYPPGIPLIVAGEEITDQVRECLNRANEFNWQGWEGFDRGQIMVVDM